MTLSDDGVERFRIACKKAYGEEVTATNAREMALRVLLLYELLYSSIPDEVEVTQHSPVTVGVPPSSPQADVSF